MNNNMVYFIFGGLLAAVIGYGLGLITPLFRGERRILAVQEGVRARRRAHGDQVIETTPAVRLYVRDMHGGSHVAFVADDGEPVEAVTERLIARLSVWWKPPATDRAARRRTRSVFARSVS